MEDYVRKRKCVCVYIYMYVWLGHFAVQQKLTKHYKSTTKKNLKKKETTTSQLNANKTDNLEEMDKFLEKYNLPRLNKDKTEKMKRSITSTGIEAVIKKTSKGLEFSSWLSG